MIFYMTVRWERIGDRYALVLTQQQLDDLCLRGDAEMTLEAVSGKLELTPVQDAPAVERATADEAFAAYKRTESQYAEVYRELAK